MTASPDGAHRLSTEFVSNARRRLGQGWRTFVSHAAEADYHLRRYGTPEFLSAALAMQEAFVAVFGREADFDDDVDMALWNICWDQGLAMIQRAPGREALH